MENLIDSNVFLKYFRFKRSRGEWSLTLYIEKSKVISYENVLKIRIVEENQLKPENMQNRFLLFFSRFSQNLLKRKHFLQIIRSIMARLVSKGKKIEHIGCECNDVDQTKQNHDFY